MLSEILKTVSWTTFKTPQSPIFNPVVLSWTQGESGKVHKLILGALVQVHKLEAKSMVSIGFVRNPERGKHASNLIETPLTPPPLLLHSVREAFSV